MNYGPIKKPKKQIIKPPEYYHRILENYGYGVFAAIYTNDYFGKQVFKNEWCGDGTLSRNEEGQLFWKQYFLQ